MKGFNGQTHDYTQEADLQQYPHLFTLAMFNLKTIDPETPNLAGLLRRIILWVDPISLTRDQTFLSVLSQQLGYHCFRGPLQHAAVRDNY